MRQMPAQERSQVKILHSMVLLPSPYPQVLQEVLVYGRPAFIISNSTRRLKRW